MWELRWGGDWPIETSPDRVEEILLWKLTILMDNTLTPSRAATLSFQYQFICKQEPISDRRFFSCDLVHKLCWMLEPRRTCWHWEALCRWRSAQATTDPDQRQSSSRRWWLGQRELMEILLMLLLFTSENLTRGSEGQVLLKTLDYRDTERSQRLWILLDLQNSCNRTEPTLTPAGCLWYCLTYFNRTSEHNYIFGCI